MNKTQLITIISSTLFVALMVMVLTQSPKTHTIEVCDIWEFPDKEVIEIDGYVFGSGQDISRTHITKDMITNEDLEYYSKSENHKVNCYEVVS